MYFMISYQSCNLLYKATNRCKPDSSVPRAIESGAKTIKKNTNSTQNKSQTHRAKQYEVTSFLSTDCELSTETCSKNVHSLGPWFAFPCIRYKSSGCDLFATVSGQNPTGQNPTGQNPTGQNNTT